MQISLTTLMLMKILLRNFQKSYFILCEIGWFHKAYYKGTVLRYEMPQSVLLNCHHHDFVLNFNDILTKFLTDLFSSAWCMTVSCQMFWVNTTYIQRTLNLMINVSVCADCKARNRLNNFYNPRILYDVLIFYIK